MRETQSEAVALYRDTILVITSTSLGHQENQDDSRADPHRHHRALHEPYGTIEDWEEMLETCHKHGMKLSARMVQGISFVPGQPQKEVVPLGQGQDRPQRGEAAS
jgi:hypothetical protein